MCITQDKVKEEFERAMRHWDVSVEVTMPHEDDAGLAKFHLWGYDLEAELVWAYDELHIGNDDNGYYDKLSHESIWIWIAANFCNQITRDPN